MSNLDVYFGPKALAEKQSNWVQTILGRGWTRSFGCMARSSHFTTRRGGREISNRNPELIDAAPSTGASARVQFFARATEEGFATDGGETL
jgi:hypothetical protein